MGVWEHWEGAAACSRLLGISVWAGDKKELRLPPHPNSPAGPALLVGTVRPDWSSQGGFSLLPLGG